MILDSRSGIRRQKNSKSFYLDTLVFVTCHLGIVFCVVYEEFIKGFHPDKLVGIYH